MPDDQGPNMEMRAFIAVVLSLGVMLGYQFFFAPPPPDPVAPPIEVPAPVEQVEETLPDAAAEPVEDPASTGGAEEAGEPALVAGDGPRQLVLETERYRMVLDNRGAVIANLELVGFDADFGGPLELVIREPGFGPGGLLKLATPEAPQVAAEANSALYRMTVDGAAAPSSLRATRPVEVRWQWVSADGWNVDKRLTISPDGYLSDFSITAESPVDTPMFITLGAGLEMRTDMSRTGIYLLSGAILFDGQALWDDLGDASLEEPQITPAQVAFGGIQSPYFLAAFVPESPATVYLHALPAPETVETDAVEEADAAPPGDPGTRATFGLQLRDGVRATMPLYLGPKDYNTLLAEGHDLEQAVDYGFFRILARPVAVTLETLNEFTGNYGLAIILATFGVRLIFFPLSQSSMKSMRKMQQLQPQMNAIRAKYKGVKDVEKRQEMNTQVMKLYKDHGVSPLGGCLPMLLQMPVLFGFYAAISVSIASRHAPFALWLQDLSRMDPYYVLPLLMGASMYAQQRMSPGTGDPMQQRIFRLMPIMFTFFFLTFPAGLVIYWLVNTVLGIAQQGYVNKQLGAADAIVTPGPRSKPKKGSKGGAAKRKKRGKR